MIWVKKHFKAHIRGSNSLLSLTIILIDPSRSKEYQQKVQEDLRVANQKIARMESDIKIGPGITTTPTQVFCTTILYCVYNLCVM